MRQPYYIKHVNELRPRRITRMTPTQAATYFRRVVYKGFEVIDTSEEALSFFRKIGADPLKAEIVTTNHKYDKL